MGWGGNEIAIAIRCDAVGISTETGRRAQIVICGFLGGHITETTKNVEFRQGIVLSLGD